MKTIVILLISCLYHFPVISQVTSFAIDEDQLNTLLKDSLERIYESDQSVRMELAEAIRSGMPKAYLDSLRQAMAEHDSINLVLVNSIIDRHGWVSPTSVGVNAAQGLFLVIQHADLNTQEKYLPMIIEAENRGQILSSNLAILIDRINMRKGEKQMYGSQGFKDKETGKTYIYPISNLDKLDSRRQSMGLPPMKEYVIGWDIEKYRLELPNIEKIWLSQGVE